MSIAYEDGYVVETDPLSEDRQLIELLKRGEVEAVSERLAEIAKRDRQRAVVQILTAGSDILK